MSGTPNFDNRNNGVRFDLNKLFRWSIVLILYLIIFILLDLFTHKLQLFPGVVAWYPPDGVSLAFLITFCAGFAPVMILASIASSLFVYKLSTPLGPILFWAIFVVSLYMLNALLLRRVIRINTQLKTIRDTLWLLLTSAIVAMILSVIAVSSLIKYGQVPADQFFNASIHWWIGEMIGVLVFTPFFLIYVMPWINGFLNGMLPKLNTDTIFHWPSLQTLGQWISIPLILFLVFCLPSSQGDPPSYLLAAPLIWIALTKGFPRVSLAIVIMNFGSMIMISIYSFGTTHLGEFQFLMFFIYFSALLTGAIVTKQKRTEQELYEKEIHYQALIENAPDAIISLGINGKLKFLSPSVQRILGYKPEEQLGFNPLEFIHPEDQSKLIQLLDDLEVTPGKVVSTNFRYRHKDGSWRWLECTLVNRLTESSVQAIVCNFRDITERKQADDLLHSSEQRFKALVEHSMEEISMVTSDGLLIYESPASQHPLGYSYNTFIGQQLFDLFHPDDKEGAIQLFKEVVSQPGFGRDALFRLRHKNGSWRWMEGFITNLLDEPAVQSVVINYRDITERKLAEEEIIIKNDELSMLFNLSHSLAEAESLNDILDLINRHAVESVHTTFARIALLDEENYILRAAYPARVLDQDLGNGDKKFILLLPYSQHILEKNKPMVLHANNPDIDPEEKKSLLLDFAQSICLVPLCIRDSSPVSQKIIGLLMLGEARNEGREPFTPEKMRLAQTIGDSAAIAIQRMLLHEKTDRSMQQLIALSEIDQAIISNSDMLFSLRILLTQVIEQLKIDAANIWIFNKTNQVLEFVTGRGFLTNAYENAKPIHLGEGYAGRAALERQTIHINNLVLQNLNPRLASALEDEPFISYYAVPLIVKDQVTGVIELFDRKELESNGEWLKFLHLLANQAAMAIDNSSLFNDLQLSNVDLTQAYDATIQGWSRALDLRDNETEGHTQRVTELTMQLARQFGLSDEALIHIRRGALLHDIGKMGVPDSILLKPGSLTDDEWLVMRKHPTFAYELLSPIQYLRPALDIPFYHHEKWDGTGYPLGLRGDQIPIAARIFAVVDVWDALISDRPYRSAWPVEKVLEHIRSMSGTHFDPQIVNICLESNLFTGYSNQNNKMELIQWSEKFSVGVKELDQQHQQLIKLLNRLISISGSINSHSEIVANILLEMNRYAEVHFKTEERLMDFYHYPDFEKHKSRHKEFSNKITEFAPPTSISVEQIPMALLEYLTNWWVYHILEEDMLFRSFFENLGLN